MDTQDIPSQTLTQNENDNAFARLDFLFSQIPDHIYDWLFSDQAAVNVTALAKRFSLSEVQTVQLARLTGLVILKDMSLATMTLEFKKSLGLDDAITRQLAISTATTQFLLIRDHLVGVEEFIKQLGGSLPAALPPLLKLARPAHQTAVSGTLPRDEQSIAMPTPTTIVIQKTLRQLVKDNKDALNQNLTDTPIRIVDFDQPVRPTIKNWLVDYVKLKGAGHHESLERSDYLFNSPNTKTLSEEERTLVSTILNAYDNDSPLPINAQDNTILLRPVLRPAATSSTGASKASFTGLERLVAPAKSSAVPRALPRDSQFYGGERSEFYAAPPSVPTAPQPPQPVPYREPISQEDLSGPLKQPSPTRGVPRLSGNIIDLKDLQ